mmetsp:Transcript_25834/g.72638  ORF Transcript_25834/g.72638 Transcript_25834/m.72638 type:complete len:237 (-) Transcript_25834:12-722(-)
MIWFKMRSDSYAGRDSSGLGKPRQGSRGDTCSRQDCSKASLNESLRGKFSEGGTWCFRSSSRSPPNLWKSSSLTKIISLQIIPLRAAFLQRSSKVGLPLRTVPPALALPLPSVRGALVWVPLQPGNLVPLWGSCLAAGGEPAKCSASRGASAQASPEPVLVEQRRACRKMSSASSAAGNDGVLTSFAPGPPDHKARDSSRARHAAFKAKGDSIGNAANFRPSSSGIPPQWWRKQCL